MGSQTDQAKPAPTSLRREEQGAEYGRLSGSKAAYLLSARLCSVSVAAACNVAMAPIETKAATAKIAPER